MSLRPIPVRRRPRGDDSAARDRGRDLAAHDRGRDSAARDRGRDSFQKKIICCHLSIF